MFRKLGHQFGEVLKLTKSKVELSSQNVFLAKHISQQRPRETDLQMTLGHNSDGRGSIKRKQKLIVTLKQNIAWQD